MLEKSLNFTNNAHANNKFSTLVLFLFRKLSFLDPKTVAAESCGR